MRKSSTISLPTASRYSRSDGVQSIFCLIFYLFIFISQISKEELDQEAIILNKLVQINQLAITARTEIAGEEKGYTPRSTVLTHVSIDSKHSGEPIPIQVWKFFHYKQAGLSYPALPGTSKDILKWPLAPDNTQQ